VVVDNGDILLVMAELSLGFAGFASVVVTFRRRDSEPWKAPDAFAYRGMLRSSLFACFFALLPFPIGAFGATDRADWALSSGALAIYVAFTIRVLVAFVRVVGLPSGLRRYFISICIGYAACLVLQLLNAVDVGFHREFPPYLLGVSWLLGVAGINFFRLVSIPEPRRRRRAETRDGN
jgi:hypothetical protein